MSPSKEVVIAILIGSFAIAFARVDVGKALGRARVSLHADKARGNHLAPDLGRSPIKIHVGNPDIDEIPLERADAPFAYEPINNSFEPRHGPSPAVSATPCQTAEQWEGRASEWDHILGINNRFNITFDGVNRRKRIMEDKHAQLPGKRIYEYIMLFDEGIQYVINHNYNTCTVESLGTWRNFTIPPNSTLEDYYEIGAPGSGFMVQEWSDRIPGRQEESWIGTFTDNGCWPVTEIFMDKDENRTMIQSVSTKFFDLRAGIANMSVFTPPSFCNNSQRSITPEPRPTENARPVRPTRRGYPISRTRPEVPRRFPNINRQLPTIPRDIWDARDLPRQAERALRDAILSGDHRRIPEGIDRMTYDKVLKAYLQAMKGVRTG